MKNIFLILIFISSFFTVAKAQPDNFGKKQERIQALKIAFITQKLELTTDEAQHFWPVYNRYQKDLQQINANNKNGDAIDTEEKALNVKKQYRSEFIKVIGPPKTKSFFTAEREFRGVLMRHLKNRQFQQKPASPQP